jgi:WD40 repeat protein
MAVQNQQGIPAPEGLFLYGCERLPSLISFSAEYCSRIALASLELRGGPAAGKYVLWNVGSTLFIYNAGLNERVSRNPLLFLFIFHLQYHILQGTSLTLFARVQDPLRRVEMRQPVGAGATASASSLPSGYITSISFTSESVDDEYDLLIGMSNGEGNLLSLCTCYIYLKNKNNTKRFIAIRFLTLSSLVLPLSFSLAVKALSLSAQLSAGPTNSRPISSVVFNAEGSLTPSRCVSVAWLPGSKGSFFTSAHADGNVFLHQKIIGNSSDTRLLERTSTDSSLRPAATAQQLHQGKGINAAATSPNGKYIALACRDGTLHILEIPSGTLVAGFTSYYGGLLCCSWSSDGALIAAGGEDDLVAIYNFEKRQLVAHLQGHTSWVSAVAFDPWAPSLESSGDGGRYRLASVGQDCQGILWEVGSGVLDSNSRSASIPDGVDVDSTRGGGGALVGSGGRIAPALPRAEMTFLEPLTQLKLHSQPLCDVVLEPGAMLVSSNDGSLKKFVRPTG